MFECVDCGSSNVKTIVEHEVLKWGQAGDTFECNTPVRHCQDCNAKWIDHEGMDIHTLAQFRFEKSKGITRNKFCNEKERRLWEIA
jgi:hypothetical protein